MSRATGFAALAVMLAMPLIVSADTIVYDNTIARRLAGVNPNNGEVGDGATLAGTDRLVTKLSLMIIGGAQPQNAEVRVRLYEGGDSFQAEPGDLLWESELFKQMPLLPGEHVYDFAVPRILVPESVTWTLEIRAPDPLGMGLRGPPDVGSSEVFFWIHSSGIWRRSGTQFEDSFGARIEAVPEPGALSLLAVGALGLARRWR